MQAKRRFVRVLRLANAESRRGNNQAALLGILPSGNLPKLAMRWSATVAHSSVGVGSMPCRSHASRIGWSVLALIRVT